MDDRLKKTERLIKIWILLHNNPQGYTAKELSEKFEVDPRTIYRDMTILGEDLKVPVYDDKKRWKLDEKRVLPPIRFTVPEALDIYLAARLMLGYDKRYDPNIDATFSKLGSIMPQPLGEQVQKTVDWMHTLPKDERYVRTMSEVARAWVTKHQARIVYRSLEAEQATERIIEPYFIEPAATGHASYVIAYCHLKGKIRNFRIGRIENIQLTDKTYTIPTDFDANKYFGPAFGVLVEGEVETVKLKFAPKVATLATETVWHQSQVLEKQKDGSVLMTLQVMDTVEFLRWVLWWGAGVEVLEPEKLRQGVIDAAKDMLQIYSG
jgi:predicted DNA-binding transcriptional regulator YafY